MGSSDSMDENVTKFYDRTPASLRKSSSSSTAESLSDAGDTKLISKPPSKRQQKKISRDKNKNNTSTPSKPSTSLKRSRERQEKEGKKPSSKKKKKTAQADNQGNAMAVSEAEMSARKRSRSWTAKDEVAFLKELVACCEKGKLKSLPKNMGFFYEAVRKDLDGPYSNEQMYKKLKGFKTKFFGARDKIKDKGFVGFKNAHEETVYILSKQVWGNREEKEVGSEEVGKEGHEIVEEKKNPVVGDGGGEREEMERNKSRDVEMVVKGQEGGEEEDEEDGDGNGDDGEEEEKEGHDEGEKNNYMNMKEGEVAYVSENVRNRVAGRDTEKCEENVGEETDSSEKNVAEDKDSSEESESEPSGKENSAQRDSNAALNRYKSNVRDNSVLHDSDSAPKQLNVRENSVRHVLNGAAGHFDARDNSRQLVAEGVSDRRGAATGRNDARENLSQPVEEGKSEGRRHARENSTPNDASGMSNASNRIGATEHNKNTGEILMHSVANRMFNESRRTATTIVRENSTLHASGDRSNESRRIETTDLHNNGDNLAQHISNGTANGSPCIATADQQPLFDQLRKDNLRMLDEFKSQMLIENSERFDKLKYEIANVVMKDLRGSSNAARLTNLDFSMIKGLSSARELPALSDKEVEMLDQKWKIQQLVEMEATSKHLALLQEEYQLRLANLRHK